MEHDALCGDSCVSFFTLDCGGDIAEKESPLVVSGDL